MESSKRRTHSPEFKARVAKEAISGRRKTIQEIAAVTANVRCCDSTPATTERDPLSVHERLTVLVGRRGKPVRKLHHMPMAHAHELDRKLQ
jgi:hypothetical protein